LINIHKWTSRVVGYVFLVGVCMG